MKGIILAGGSGTRLYPMTSVISKQLMPVYDKPMIFYPLSTLMLSDIRDILIIATPEDEENFKRLLGDGSSFGIKLSYAIQPKPNGLSEAFLIGEEFIGDDAVAMCLGDNIFFGEGFENTLMQARRNAEEGKATIFGYYVNEPGRFGVVEFDKEGKAVSIEEKPSEPKSNYCVTGLYFYPAKVVEYAKTLKPSNRNELEITDLNNIYLKNDKMEVVLLGRSFAWLDSGTTDSLLEASSFIQTIQKRQSRVVSSPDEIAFTKGWISEEKLERIVEKYGNSSYGNCLKKVLEDHKKYVEKRI
ncbi:MAG: glucose-1-phosphate thymidylyltransferase RfbA [Lachnospiraceae bacterium]|nr:glucose-1-phosphate thymidylyltransferase RfbA [Lachnospiraceae bacterium]